MKIVADSNMALVDELFGRHGDVVKVPGREISPEDVRDADVLLVRSTTPVNEALLRGSRVGFVGSATIGVDHVDVDWLARAGIQFASAPGCNARAVVEYDIAALASVAPDWRQRRIGVVGCGNVGGRLLAQLQALDVECMGYDPLLPPAPERVDFATVLSCDILCLHTPLTRQGAYPTWHMFDADLIAGLAPDTVLLNAGRGAVLDNGALRGRLQQKADLHVVLDVWEGEPAVDLALLGLVSIATPHIAGYSLAGRVRGTEAILASFERWLGQSVSAAEPWTQTPVALGRIGSLNDAILAAYPVGEDHHTMTTTLSGAESPAVAFDRLRRDYRHRREFAEFAVDSRDLDSTLATQLQALGFVVEGEDGG